ncbi:family 16 glycoside hydrolase [Sinomonas sp. G460-2]|uniref:family 16 glycoside hydrolase n=1 Tax=Sinomonas sp. G460-2 TaxID=3393464 RepID=UPI0039EF3A68
MTDSITILERQEEELVFESFDHADAWNLGSTIVRIDREAGHAVGIDIRRPGLVLFRAALHGITPDQESWISRKAAVVLRMEASSALVDARLSAARIDPAAVDWLGAEYAVTGGSFPIRVRGVGVVAAATASGLPGGPRPHRARHPRAPGGRPSRMKASPRQVKGGQHARIRIWERASGAVRTVFESRDRLYEAPNWTPDGRLLVNGDGLLWTLPADGSALPEQIQVAGLPDVNNDHVLAPDGRTVFASANDWHIWEVQLAGGAARRTTADDGAMHFLHGVSPDGGRLGYVRLEPVGNAWPTSATIHTIGADGTGDTAVTSHPGPADGCEWTPDGEWIVFNTEQFSTIPGHAQLARVRPDGGDLEQLAFDERVNWFPHVAPTGDVAVYLSYPPGTTGHPRGSPRRTAACLGRCVERAHHCCRLRGRARDHQRPELGSGRLRVRVRRLSLPMKNQGVHMSTELEQGFVPLFNGESLQGWHPAPRVYGAEYPRGPSIAQKLEEMGLEPPVNPEVHPARWFVEDGVVVGEQATPGYGGYLVSDETFGDFDLVIEAKPDWPADTGIMLRRQRDSWEGFQVLLDHRPSGGIGGFFGNGLASFSAVPFAINAEFDDERRPVRMVADDPATSVEPVTPVKRGRLRYAGDVEDFLRVWKWGDWNELRIRCVGPMPVITTWVNGLKVAEIDTATIDAPNYDAAAIHAVLGDGGHLALEVHDNDAMFGEARWGRGAQCRWRNARIKDLGGERAV